jgi:putative oxidoreductase
LVAYHGLEIFDPKVMQGYMDWEMFKTGNGNILPYIGKAAELISGILLSIGLLTRLSSIVLMGTMTYICFFIGKGQFWYGDQHPFLLVLLGFIYFINGGGKWAMDNWLLGNTHSATQG